MLKYLRIPVTALSLAACVLLGALWVRSYQWNDQWVLRDLDERVSHFDSMLGQITLDTGFTPFAHHQIFAWEVYSVQETLDEWKARQKLLSYGFRAAKDPDQIVLNIPHWFAVLSFAAIAGSAWLPWKGRFNLRTLLIATTLVAVGLEIFAMLR